MGNLNGIDANKMANAIENKIMQVAHQVLKNSPNDREVEGRVISRNQYNQYTIVINNYVYKNILQERSLGPISNGTIVKVKVPNNQMSNAYICGVVDGSIQTNGGTGGTTNYSDLQNKPVVNTTHTTSQTSLANEIIDGTINFHKISKTGALADTIKDSTNRTVTDEEKTTWNNKQEQLVSGTNIKTINGNSILGKGNIEIEGGGSSGSVALTQNANTIISAPANFITYSGSVVTVKAGTRVVIPNGLNADGTPNNLDYTLPADATLDLSTYSEDQRYIAIQKDGTLITLMHPYGNDLYRVYVQYTKPSMDRQWGRWFDLTNNVWKTTGDSGATWAELYCCPIGSVILGSGGGTIISAFAFKVPTDFSFTEMDKLYADMKGQDLARTMNSTITSRINTFSMLPGDGPTQSVEKAPVTGQDYFTANSNGVAYIRIQAGNNGYLGFHLRNAYGGDIAYNTQHINTNYGGIYNATFVMKAGQKIFCYENTAGYFWGGVTFVGSQTI